MVTDLMKQLLEAGVHFGHQTKRWNPKMAPFIFGQRNGIYIINLERTAERLEDACKFINEAVARGENVLFVGTKKQAKEAVLSEAQRCGMFSVTERWLGGLMTNFTTVRSSVKRMKEIEAMKEGLGMDALTKKERSALEKEWAKLNKNLSGVADMKKLPGVVIVIDPKKEETAVREARRLGIPIVALIDTNSDPDSVDFPIPGNDDAIRAIQLVLTVLTDSVMEGRKKQANAKAKAEEKSEDDK
ncbi:MAG: 30S ribosomal protein S2 [Candidatus Omnitrophica bacterium]|nr:30S ribosomal protein S2 [Candidatus Omnitrophota bacterium]